ncbi:MAG: spore cortex biosynthesis protein YabQ [Clostridiales bacterium]|nr:spore cortex biosynthesis protein YabQ [Clostridiales bacterium]
MEMSVAAQAAALSGGVVLGLGLGLLYDLFRVLRRGRPAGLGGALDVLFWVDAGLALFLWSIYATRGRVRLLTALAMALGGWLYFAALSPLLLPVLQRIADWLGRLLRFLLTSGRVLAGALKNWKIFKK